MAWKYRRRVKICPGIYLNFSNSGVSTSIGTRGYMVNYGKRGVTRTLSLPGTGMYYQTRTPMKRVEQTAAVATSQSPTNGGNMLAMILVCSAVLFLIFISSGIKSVNKDRVPIRGVASPAIGELLVRQGCGY